MVLYIVRFQVLCLPSDTPLHTAFIKHTHKLTVWPTEHCARSCSQFPPRYTERTMLRTAAMFLSSNIWRLSHVTRTGVSMIQFHTCGLAGSCKTSPPNPQLGCNMVPAVTFVGIMRNVLEPFPGKAKTSPNSETYKLLIYGHTHYITSSLTKSMLKPKTFYTSCELHSLSKFCSIITRKFCCSDPPTNTETEYTHN